MADLDWFSDDYPAARARFRSAVSERGGHLTSLWLGAKGPRGEDLSIDVGRFGPDAPVRVLLHASGIHGVEAFAGSAIQLQLLERLPALPEDTSIVFVHVLNPYGMAWLRRVNENNVDLNRNFLDDADAFSGHPDGYEALYDFLNPSWIPALNPFLIRAGWLLLRHGRATLEAAAVAGQYDYPQGLFFGGRKAQEGVRLYTGFLSDHLSTTRKVFAIDVHTGLGPFGEDTILVGQDAYARLRRVLGKRVQTLSSDDDNVAYEIRGGHHERVARLFREIGADVDFVGQEFGTYGQVRVLGALRKENWAHHHADAKPDHPYKRDLKDVFCPREEAWRQKVLARGSELFDQAVEILLSR